MSYVYLLSFIVMFSFCSELHGMRAFARAFGRLRIHQNSKRLPLVTVAGTPGTLVVKPTVSSDITLASRVLHPSNHPSLSTTEVKQFAYGTYVDRGPRNGRMSPWTIVDIVDVPFKVVEVVNESKACYDHGEAFYEIIALNGLSDESDIDNFLTYLQDTRAHDVSVYTKYMKRVLTVTLARLGDQQYIHPMLVAAVVLSSDDAFKDVYQVLSANMQRVTNENVVASYKVLEMLLKHSFDEKTKTVSFEGWDCNIPYKRLKKMFDNYYDRMPKIIAMPHPVILIKLMNGVTVLLKGLDEKTPKRKKARALLLQDLKRYEEAYEKLYMAHY